MTEEKTAIFTRRYDVHVARYSYDEVADDKLYEAHVVRTDRDHIDMVESGYYPEPMEATGTGPDQTKAIDDALKNIVEKQLRIQEEWDD